MNEKLEAASAIADTIDEWNAASHDALRNGDAEEADADSRTLPHRFTWPY